MKYQIKFKKTSIFIDISIIIINTIFDFLFAQNFKGWGIYFFKTQKWTDMSSFSDILMD